MSLRNHSSAGTVRDIYLTDLTEEISPKPNNDDCFNGGYCTATYGSRNGGEISAIQLEAHGTDLRNTAVQRKVSGAKIADAIIKYMNTHYNLLNK